MEITVMKAPSGSLVPVTDIDTQELAKLTVGKAVKMKAVQMTERSMQHHKLFYGGLITLAMEYWEPKGGLVSEQERNILRMLTKRLEKKTGNKGGFKAFVADFVEGLERHRSEVYPAATKDAEDIVHWIKMEVGHYDTLKTPGGVIKRAKSINFNSMSQEDFNLFYKKAFDVVWRTVLQHSFDSEQECENAINQLLSMG